MRGASLCTGTQEIYRGDTTNSKRVKNGQAIYNPVFEDPDWTTYASGMKAKILHSAPSHWCGTLISMLNTVME